MFTRTHVSGMQSGLERGGDSGWQKLQMTPNYSGCQHSGAVKRQIEC